MILHELKYYYILINVQLNMVDRSPENPNEFSTKKQKNNRIKQRVIVERNERTMEKEKSEKMTVLIYYQLTLKKK